MKREFLDYVEDIIEAMGDALSFVEGIDCDDFAKNKRTLLCCNKSHRGYWGGREKGTDLSKETLSSDTFGRIWLE
ncbi:MAG: hypothetical protein QW569_01070 [Candidatus Bathyarchaeia archaeon]